MCFGVNGIIRRGLISAFHSDFEVFIATISTAASPHEPESPHLSFPVQSSLSLLEMAVAGGIAGFFSGTALTPPELIKCRLQVQQNVAEGSKPSHGKIYRGPADALAHILQTDGPVLFACICRQSASSSTYVCHFGLFPPEKTAISSQSGLFRGWTAMISRDVPFNFIMFGAYETTRFCFAEGLSWWRGRSVHANEIGTIPQLISGGMGGSCGWAAIFPIDVAKSRLQTQPAYSGMSAFVCVRKILGEEGIRALYRGFSAAVMRAFPANAALFLGYEYALAFIVSLHESSL